MGRRGRAESREEKQAPEVAPVPTATGEAAAVGSAAPSAEVAVVPGVSIGDPYARFHGKIVVIDTRSNFVYLGRVVSSDTWFVELREVDVHDRNEGHSTNEKYVMEAKKYGVKVNRRSAVVVKEQIVGMSVLDDIVEY